LPYWIGKCAAMCGATPAQFRRWANTGQIQIWARYRLAPGANQKNTIKTHTRLRASHSFYQSGMKSIGPYYI